MILSEWAVNKGIGPKVLEGEYADPEINSFNSRGYNVFYYPNSPRAYTPGNYVDGCDIVNFDYCFVDFDLKSGTHPDKDSFITFIAEQAPAPTRIVDSGNGIHVYWKVQGLTAESYLRLTRRLMRLCRTDEAVGKILQLMRLPNTLNTKLEESFVECAQLYDDSTQYTAEELDKLLPPITREDEQFCVTHFNRIYKLEENNEVITDVLPSKFGQLLKDNREVKDLWAGNTDDRSRDDYRLGHIMFANGFNKDEAMSVLVNTAKASKRAPSHRKAYADGIVSKIWTFELENNDELSYSVKDILKRSGDVLKGTLFRCHPRIDNTAHGFRLGQVIGLVAGSGVGKTAFALNAFRWFAQENPDYHHFFIPLEQPANEIALRWKTMCGEDTSLHDKVHVISNYAEDGSFRHLSFDEIREYIQKFQQVNDIKVGCIVIDHIGALKKKGKNGENQDLMDICHAMKAFAVQTNTLLIMQSQSSREKAGIGDLELNKDAAYGTVYFESYCDYLITLWQPLKRCHNEQACPTVTAFKYCKIRHKNARKDIIQEDVPYYLYFNPETEQMYDMTQDQETSFKFFLPKSTNKRKADRKTEVITYQSVPYK